VGELAALDVGLAVDNFAAELKAIPTLSCALFGIDISLNDDAAKHHGVAWQVHVYGCGYVGDRADFRRRLAAAYPRTPSVDRPVRVAAFDGSPLGLSYIFKLDAVRRIAYRGQKSGRRCWNTRKVRLRAPEHVELLIKLNDIGLPKRIGLIHVRPNYADNRIVLQLSDSGDDMNSS
jgi:hypothetical protein